VKIEYHKFCVKCKDYTIDIREGFCRVCLGKKMIKIIDEKIYKELLSDNLGSPTAQFKVSTSSGN